MKKKYDVVKEIWAILGITDPLVGAQLGLYKLSKPELLTLKKRIESVHALA